ncbi:hypothetical protein B296_00037709 [Ensete ventricosum]|uniref:PPPDE domain-containing protein n=1 Tax=Ensete ventricosum TaxID=4639 RepID=A0A426YR40_ENSVE|nr:hypothetical protein B296_00037709 [Ensete ventricosum]
MASLVRRLFKRGDREREGEEETRGRMQEVVAHVYDVTNSPSAKTNNTVTRINCIFKDCIGLGGIFHSAIQVSPSLALPRSSLSLSLSPFSSNFKTHCSRSEVNKILKELIRAWTGDSYDPLSKNCNHFCDAFCEKLGFRVVLHFLGWVNRFANTCNTAMGITQNAASCVSNYCSLFPSHSKALVLSDEFKCFDQNVEGNLSSISKRYNEQAKAALDIYLHMTANMLLLLQLRQAKAEIGSAIKVASKFIATQASNSPRRPKSQSDRNQGSPHDMISRLKYMISFCSTSQIPDETADPTESS